MAPVTDKIAWPTLWVAFTIYLGFGATTWWFHLLPLWISLPVGACLLAWYGSLQHEVVHGHPTPSRWFNRLLVFLPLWLWLPFERYVDDHRRHHAAPHLTHPGLDTESFFVSPKTWDNYGALRRRVLILNNTLVGRLTIGPLLTLWTFFQGEVQTFSTDPKGRARMWFAHLMACVVVIGWVTVVCDIPLWLFLVGMVYPALSLTLLRSFAEHEANEDRHTRTVIVVGDWFTSLLYLNNNLHAVHHANPGMPWFKLPDAWRAQQWPNARVFNGYQEIIAQYWCTPRAHPVYPYLLDEQ